MRRNTLCLFWMLLLLKGVALKAAFTAADLPIMNGKVYHLAIGPEQLAPNIIIVGDPDRVPLLADACLKKENRSDVYHRGLRTITGETETGLRITITTSGMGTPSSEIVLNELVALNEIDFASRERRAEPLYKTLNIVRLGTSGGLQAETELGSLVITTYALGLDNSGLFYASSSVDEKILALEKLCKEKLDQAANKNSRFRNIIYPYAAAATPELVNALYKAGLEETAKVIKGITASNAGFFANQGRDISRVPLTVPDIDRICAEISFDGMRVENMEMEASFLCHFVSSLGYRVGAIWPVIATRALNTFYSGSYNDTLLTALKIILKAFDYINQPATS